MQWRILVLPAIAVLLPATSTAVPNTTESASYTFPSAPETRVGTATSSDVLQADDGLFYVEAQVNGHPVRFIVDSGASVVVLTREDARRVGAPMTARSGVQLETAGGSSAMRWTVLNRVNVAGQRLDDVEATVVESGMPVSLMGQSVLSRLQSVAFKGNRLRLN